MKQDLPDGYRGRGYGSMLQKLEFDEEFPVVEQDLSYLLRPSFYWEVLKRRWPLLILPILVIAPLGVAVALLWPPTYLSEGKVLVQTQQIPTDLVRPTVTNAAQERIQVIQQRTMTRDNLIAIADKFKLFPDKRALMSATEIVEKMKKQIKITPVDLGLDFKQRGRNENPTIVFSVGFEYSDPERATQVANELMTRILNEDLRDRTSRATDTTKFLAREVQRLQSESTALDAKIARLKLEQGKPASPTAPDQPMTTLAQLKAELLQKSALYSDRHPMIQSLKRQIEALESAVASRSAGSAGAEVASSANIDALTVQQDSLQKNLEVATTKLAAARLGENLEKDQQSEKLEVIEQPTVPQEPVTPKRLKIVALSLLLAAAASVGLPLIVEMTDKTIRRAGDLSSVVNGQLIVLIPYILTANEQRRQKRRLTVLLLAVAIILVVGLAAGYLFLPIDLIIAKAQVGLFR